MNRNVLLVGAILTLPLILFLAIGLTKDPFTINSPLVGQPAPPFALMDLSGNTVSLEDLKGKPVVLNFWATWCVPCKAEHPILMRGARDYQGRVTFVGVIFQDDPMLIRRYVASAGAPGPTLIDDSSAVAIAYGVYGVPETYLIGADGVIAEKIIGPVNPNNFFDKIESLL